MIEICQEAKAQADCRNGEIVERLADRLVVGDFGVKLTRLEQAVLLMLCRPYYKFKQEEFLRWTHTVAKFLCNEFQAVLTFQTFAEMLIIKATK